MAKRKKLLQVWLSDFELALLDTLAGGLGMNRSQVIRYCLAWLTKEKTSAAENTVTFPLEEYERTY